MADVEALMAEYHTKYRVRYGAGLDSNKKLMKELDAGLLDLELRLGEMGIAVAPSVEFVLVNAEMAQDKAEEEAVSEPVGGAEPIDWENW